jgi:hypothetical protein
MIEVTFAKQKRTSLHQQIKLLVFIAAALLFGVATWASAKDGRWIDPTDPTIPVDVMYQGEYIGTLKGGSKLGCQVVSLGSGVFQAVLYPGGLPGAGWDGKNRSIMDGKLEGDHVVFQAAAGKRKHVAATRGREKTPSSTRVSLVTTFPPVGHKPCTAKINGAMMNGFVDGMSFALTKTIRKSPTLGQKPPDDAIVLFDGSNMKEWTGGSVNKNYATLMPIPGDLISKRHFNNYTIHLEFMLPYQPVYRSQDRGNSGFYQVHDYEIQVLDSFAMDGAHNECGGIYSHNGSRVNMCLPPLVWQTFDVEFTNSIMKNGKKVKNAVITVRHNGVLIHDKFAIPGKSKYGVRKSPEGTPGSIKLQNHREPLQYRNIWIVPHGPVPALPPSKTVTKPTKKPPTPPTKKTIKPIAPTTDAAKSLIGKWNIRFIGNSSIYVLELKSNGSSHLARKGKAWDGAWAAKDGILTITNPHDVIRIPLNPKDGVYSGKNNWGAARLSRDELQKF